MESPEVDDEKLIYYVEKNPVLYNKNEKLYRNIIRKDLVWKEIAVSMNVTTDIIMKRWKYLREKFNTEQKKRKPESGQSPMPTEFEWPLFNNLLFLKQHIQPKV